MIEIKEKNQCAGCNACVNMCTRSALSMKYDRNGFMYPIVDVDNCIDCGLCDYVCPMSHPLPIPSVKPQVIAAINKDFDVRKRSSSGGAFYALAKYVLDLDGIVFGVQFDGLHVKHGYAEDSQGVETFMGSKYVQSDVGNSYRIAKNFLDDNRYVLFSGTPCQVAGLKRFLRKDYEKLITVDLICHGVPSPGIWEGYMKNRLHKLKAIDIKNISFRNKDFGMFVFYFFCSFLGVDNRWHEIRERRQDNSYFSLFLRHIFRPACYDCQFRSLDSYADFTIGDCWNVQTDHPQLYDDMGISTIIAHSSKSQQILSSINAEFTFEIENPDIMRNRYEEYVKETYMDKHNTQWKLFYLLQPYFSLDNLKFIWRHDKFHIVLKRKLKKLWKNTK